MPKGALAVVGHAGPVSTGEGMSAPHALAALAALGQPTRLEIFALLMRAEPDGMAAGSSKEVASGSWCLPHARCSRKEFLQRLVGFTKRNGCAVLAALWLQVG